MTIEPDRRKRKRNKWRRRLRQPIESAVIRTWLSIGPRLSRKATVRLANVLARIAYTCSRRACNVGFANLDCIYGDTLTRGEKETLLRKSLQTNCLTLLDIFWFSRNPKERIEKYVHWTTPIDVFNEGRPVTCVTAHYGNWEILGQRVVVSGFPLMSVAHPLINEYADNIFIKIRTAIGQEIASSSGAIRKLLTCLKGDGNIALVMDQNTKPKRGGIFVDFFGIPVPVSTAPASLALKTNSIIAIGFCHADDEGHYHSQIPHIIRDLPQHADAEKNVQELTQTITYYSEKQIRDVPEPWMWTYKRWSHIQPGTDRDRYPTYALPMLEKEL